MIEIQLNIPLKMNKQISSVEFLEIQMIKNGMIVYNDIIKAKEMHKQEIEAAYWAGVDEDKMIYPSEDCNGYYNQTFEQ